MAVFKIKSINYIVGGTTEKIINFDLFSDTDDAIILNKSFVTDEDSEENTNINAEKNTHRLFKKSIKTNENDDFLVFLSTDFHALFDFKDIAVKSDFYKEDNTAVFGPKLSSNPLGFVQGIKGDAYGATASEKESSIIAFTNLADTRNSRLNGNSTSITWYYKLKSPGSLAYTYRELRDMKYPKKVWTISNTISTRMEDANSITEWLEKNYGELSGTDGITDLLEPKYDNTGLDRTYLYNIKVTNKKSNSLKWNEFNSGNIFGNVFSGKNFYDSKYSTDISTDSVDDGNWTIRKYVKIGETGGWPFLVYYDNKNLSLSSAKETTEDGKTIRDGIIEQNPNGRPYQHVETINSLNRFMNRGNHKSNMYSIRLDLGLKNLVNFDELDEENQEKMNTLLDTVKLDIRNSIRRITTSLAPAHTQLFKVYIDKE